MDQSAVKFPVFRDDKGNRFVFPSIREDDEKSISFWQCMELRLAIGVEEEPERIAVPVIDGEMRFPHVKSEIMHHGFKHGAATVYLIGGPVFDAIAAE